MSKTVTFAIGSTSYEVNGPPASGNQAVRPFPRFVGDQATDGTRRSYQINSSTRQIVSLTLNELTSQMRDDLLTFFHSDVGGPGVDFDFTGTEGNVYNNVQFVDNSLNYDRSPSRGNFFVMNVRLEIKGNWSG